MASTSTLAGVVLAAGKGTRMKSAHPKCLMPVGGVPMAELVGRAMKGAGVARPIMVVGFGASELQRALGESYEYALQENQLGTGDAVRCAAPLIDQDLVIVSPGDTPLLSAEVFTRLVAEHRSTGAEATVATFIRPNPHGYGRILRDEAGRFTRIVEQKDATEEQRSILEVNAGLYCFDTDRLKTFLPRLRNDNAQREYYLTDVLQFIAQAGWLVDTVTFDDERILMGVNDRWDLAQAGAALREDILRCHALAGVTIIDPHSTFIGLDVRIEPDTTIEPNTTLIGFTTIGANCVIGPHTRILDSEIGQGCTILMSHLARAEVGEGSRVGPFANLRPGARLGQNVKIGNFVEVKQSVLGDGASASHLSYIGDAIVGQDANIGAGTVTCNYDGVDKHATVIEDGAFVGSNSTLIAPVRIGRNAIVGGGSVITSDVPEDALALGRQRQENKEGWVSRWRERRTSGRV